MTSLPAIVFVDIDDLPVRIDDGHRRLPSLLASLVEQRIISVFCSSGTREQVDRFRHHIGVFHPFICESGATLFVPPAYFGCAIPGARSIAGYEALEFTAPHGVKAVTLTASLYKTTLGPALMVVAGRTPNPAIAECVDVVLSMVGDHASARDTVGWLEDLAARVQTIRQVRSAAPWRSRAQEMTPRRTA
jgi:hypothetical protein